MRRLIAIFFLLTACTTTRPISVTTPSAGSNDELLRTHLRNYVVGFLRLNPSVNAYLGCAGLDPSLKDADARLSDHSSAAIAREDAWLSEVARDLASIDPATLSASSRIDRDVALAQIRYQLHLHQVRKWQQRSLDSYTDEPFRAVDFYMQGMTPTGAASYGTTDEWRTLIARVNAIPASLATAEQQ